MRSGNFFLDSSGLLDNLNVIALRNLLAPQKVEENGHVTFLRHRYGAGRLGTASVWRRRFGAGVLLQNALAQGVLAQIYYVTGIYILMVTSSLAFLRS